MLAQPRRPANDRATRPPRFFQILRMTLAQPHIFHLFLGHYCDMRPLCRYYFAVISSPA